MNIGMTKGQREGWATGQCQSSRDSPDAWKESCLYFVGKAEYSTLQIRLHTYLANGPVMAERVATVKKLSFLKLIGYLLDDYNAGQNC